MALHKPRLALPLMAVLAAPGALAQTDLLELPATDVTGVREQTSYKPEQSESALKIDAALRDIRKRPAKSSSEAVSHGARVGCITCCAPTLYHTLHA
jgi:hypothetical protein